MLILQSNMSYIQSWNIKQRAYTCIVCMYVYMYVCMYMHMDITYVCVHTYIYT